MSSELLSRPGRKRRLMVIGGFLGAGKTSAIVQLVKLLQAQNQRAAVITNDHGSELVDQTLLQAEGISTEAIEGGDLCTQAEETIRAAARLGGERGAQIVIAEPAGTCADLADTLIAPARRQLAGEFSIAPLSVLVDPARAARVFGLESGGKLAAAIASLYRRQIEEAEIVLLTKSDEASQKTISLLRQTLGEVAPEAKIFAISTKTGAGLDEWVDCLMTKETSVRADQSFAARAGRGSDSEALLAWLNCTVSVSSVKYFEAGKLLLELGTCVQSLLQQEGGELAHLKIALDPKLDGGGIAAVSLDRYDASPRLLRDATEPIQRGELILNARAECDPEILHSVVNRALLALMEHSPELFARMRHCEHFKAGLSCRERSVAVE